MNKHLLLATNFTKKAITQIGLFHKELPKKKRFFLYASEIVILVLFLYFANSSQNKPIEETAATTKEVHLSKVSDLSNGMSNSPFLGTVVSVNEATIRSESSGRLAHVYKSLGDSVLAGDIIAEFDNSAEKASLLQAEGAYEAAKASKDISGISGGNSALLLAESKNGALNTLSSAYNTFDDVIRVKTDSAFSDPRTKDAKIILSTPDAALVYSLEDRRKTIEDLLKTRDEINKSLSTDSDLIGELTKAEKEAQFLKSYLDDLAKAYSKSLPNNGTSQANLDASKAVVSGARSQVSALIAQIQSSRSGLNSSIAAKNISEKTGGSEGVTSADAQVKQALGAYEAALARYQKTIVRSPLSGTINSLSVKTGDFVATFAQIGVISNNGSLEIRSYLNEDEVSGVHVGATSTIKKGTASFIGKVTKVAEAIDPLTKKLEMRVALLSDAKSELLNGESVTLTVEKEVKSTLTPSRIEIPLSALKMTSDGATVFTVANGKTVQKSVKEGAIYGDSIEIKEGLLLSDEIVVDARGLKNDTPVTIK